MEIHNFKLFFQKLCTQVCISKPVVHEHWNYISMAIANWKLSQYPKDREAATTLNDIFTEL